jgi:predicted transcriptional regulator
VAGINLREQSLHGLDTAQRAWRLYVQHGLTQAQIAGELQLTQSAVSKAIKRAEQLGLETLRASVASHKALQLARLERIYALAMDGFERSIGERVRKASSTKAGTKGDEVSDATVTEVVQGDPRWLQTALQALGDMRRLLGLDAPAKLHVTEPNRPHAGLTEHEIRVELGVLLAQVGVDPASLSPAASRAIGAGS